MLTFPYWEELRDGQVRLLPLIPLTIHGGGLERDPRITTYALVDSGAEHNVFSLDVAEALSLDLTDAVDVTIAGIGGQPHAGHLTEIDLQLGDYPNHHLWTASVILSPAVTEQPLLGQQGFFDHFNVTFRYHRRDMQITPFRSSPAERPHRLPLDLPAA